MPVSRINRALCVHAWREVGCGRLLTSNYRDRDYSWFSFTDVCRQSSLPSS